MSTIDLYPSPIEHDLTVKALAELAVPARALVPGDTWDQVFRVVDADGDAESIAGATIVMSVRRRAPGSSLLFDRDTATDITGEVAGTKQIALSATPADGTFTVRFRAGDEALLLTAAGLADYDIRVKFSASRIETRAQGVIQVMPTPTANGAIP